MGHRIATTDLGDWRSELENIFGSLDAFAGSDHDTMELARRLVRGDAERPKLYQCCGTADFLYDQNLRFRDQAAQLGLELTYEEDAGREHEWGYWDETIQRVLRWLPLPRA